MWHWCPTHNFWARHNPTECKDKGWKTNNEESENTGEAVSWEQNNTTITTSENSESQEAEEEGSDYE